MIPIHLQLITTTAMAFVAAVSTAIAVPFSGSPKTPPSPSSVNKKKTTIKEFFMSIGVSFIYYLNIKYMFGYFFLN